jgi:ATP-dependent RNA helicase MSS116
VTPRCATRCSVGATSHIISNVCCTTESTQFVRYYQTPAEQVEVFPNFDDVSDLHPLSKTALREKGLTTMSEIQAKTWKPVLDGMDVLGRARTGTGKTLGFLLPGLEQLLKNRVPGRVGMLILSPTRELALQIQEVASMLCMSHGSLASQAIFGGTSKADDIRKMGYQVPDILVATPGRILDHLNNTHVNGQPFRDLLQNLQVLVLDETDRLLDMGFRDDIDLILNFLPRNNRQTLLFSATIPLGVKSILHSHLRHDFVTVDCIRDEDPSTHTNAKVDQSFVLLKPERMLPGSVEILLHLMEQPNHKVMVFFPTNNLVIFYAALLSAMGKQVLDIHAKKGQSVRTRVSNRFRNMSEGVLLTSDVSARGVDYPDVTHVVQLGMTQDRETYIHRLGRTARAGKKGKGILILTDPEQGFLRDLHGMDLHSDEHFQKIVDGPPTELLEKSLGPIVQSVRNGRLPVIEETARDAYQSIVGLIAGRLKSINAFSARTVVNIVNSFATGIGLAEMPSISTRCAQQAGIMYEPGVNVGGGGRSNGYAGGFGSSRGGRESSADGGFGNRYSRPGGYQRGGSSDMTFGSGSRSRFNDETRNSGFGGFGSRSQPAFGGGFGSDAGFGRPSYGSFGADAGFGSGRGGGAGSFGSDPPARQSGGFGSSGAGQNFGGGSGFDRGTGFGSDVNRPSGGFGSAGFGTRSNEVSSGFGQSNHLDPWGSGDSGFGGSQFGGSSQGKGFSTDGFGRSNNTKTPAQDVDDDSDEPAGQTFK